MMITVSAFKWVPDFAQGLVRDLRVRWALEEAGWPYEVLLIESADQGTDSYRALQPFGQVPAYRENGFVMFESAAIVLHIAERSDALMPGDAAAQALTKTWLFAAINTMEPAFDGLADLDLFHAGEDWVAQRRPAAEAHVKTRLAELAAVLAGKDYLVGGRFTAADLLMATVLRNLRHTTLVADEPVLDAYLKRCQARPAFRKALADQLATFEQNAPAA
ncbi:glutathione S-transferase family protein [Caulobacter sp. NIBR2454]|uniref:glutathione S-transferase family protein n=1 Tax=Caulobacter sp. NIBR2454 TaxID=3015996 RepID=UPI0022B6658F|nr:glutathione S-transferase family protein [Caulobacter sp. NIBR2454]